MGYKPTRKLYTMKYDEYPGLVVRATSTDAKSFLKIGTLADKKDSTDEDLLDLFGEFAKVLKSWNIEEEDDSPKPATLDGLLSLEFDMVMAIIMGWMEAVAGVSPPLEQPSKDIATLLMEESIPMEPLFESQAS